jgi:iron(III) transport system substrate-binding protein
MKKNLVALLLVFGLLLTYGCSAPAATPAATEAPAAETAAPDLPPAPTPEPESWAVKNKMNDGTETADELYALAKEEGTVVLYSISSRCVKVKESFEAKYPGIICDAYDISSDELMEKVTREYESGVRNADVIHCKDLNGSVYSEKVSQGIFHNYYPADIVNSIIDADYLKYSMPLYVELNQWFYNSKLFDAPPVDSWWDLTREEWKGNLIMQDPVSEMNYMSVFTSFLAHVDEIEADYEREFGEKLVLSDGCENAAYELIYRLFNNDVIFMSSSDEVCESVAGTGVTEKKLGYGASSKARKNADNGWSLAPINILPSTGIPNQNNLYIVNECPHPNAAKLLVRWMVGEADGTGEGFTPFNTLGGWSVRNNVPDKEGNTPLTELNVWPADVMFIYDHMQDMEDFFLTMRG